MEKFANKTVAEGQLSKETVVQGDFNPRTTFVQGDRRIPFALSLVLAQ